MSKIKTAIEIIQGVARKILTQNQPKGVITIPNRMTSEAKAGEIAATLQNAGLPLNRADEFIRSEQDLVGILNLIESTPPVTREVPSGIRSTESAKVFNIKGDELDPNKPIIGGTQPGKKIDTDAVIRLAERNPQLIKQRIADKKIKKDEDSLAIEAMIKAKLDKDNKKDMRRRVVCIVMTRTCA